MHINAQYTFSFQKWPHVKNFWKTNEGVKFLLMTTLPTEAKKDEKQMIKNGYKTSNRSDNDILQYSPIKNKSHELKVDCAGKTLELDPTGGVLFTLTALAIVTIITVQLLLLNSGWNNTLRPLISDLHRHMELSGTRNVSSHLQKLCNTLREVFMSLNVQLQLIKSRW